MPTKSRTRTTTSAAPDLTDAELDALMPDQLAAHIAKLDDELAAEMAALDAERAELAERQSRTRQAASLITAKSSRHEAERQRREAEAERRRAEDDYDDLAARSVNALRAVQEKTDDLAAAVAETLRLDAERANLAVMLGRPKRNPAVQRISDYIRWRLVAFGGLKRGGFEYPHHALRKPLVSEGGDV